MRGTLFSLMLIAGLGLGVPSGTWAQDAKLPPPDAMTADYLARDDVIDTGKTVWAEQCVHCHGKNAYPGKAPKLKPKKYLRRSDGGAPFVWDRVANGFRKMPPWKDVYSEEELMGLVGFILSKRFSP